jgi:hypothetical protein
MTAADCHRDRELMGYTPEQLAHIEARDREFAAEEKARRGGNAVELRRLQTALAQEAATNAALCERIAEQRDMIETLRRERTARITAVDDAAGDDWRVL